MDTTFEFSIAFALGVGSGAAAIWHEYQWRTRLKGWKRSQGVIVRNAGGDEADHPEIEFSYRDKPKRFISMYGYDFLFFKSFKIGSVVDIIVNPSTGEAEQISILNRWLFTLVPALLSVMIVTGVMTDYKRNAETQQSNPLPLRSHNLNENFNP